MKHYKFSLTELNPPAGWRWMKRGEIADYVNGTKEYWQKAAFRECYVRNYIITKDYPVLGYNREWCGYVKKI